MPNELSLPPPMSDAALRQAAQTQVGGEIAGEIGPLEGELGSLEGRSGAAVQDIDKLFSTLQPSIESSAHRVGEFNTGMLNMERGIFDAATDRMNQFRQARAAEAQALAQQLGAPVPISEFTFAQDVEGQLAPQDFAGSMLHAMGYAQAGTAEAEAFAGRVFPLIRKEETLRTQRYFADQITKIRKEIAAIKATEKGKANARFNELRLAEREYRLNRFEAMQNAMETKRALAQRREELKQARDRLRLERDQLQGYSWRKIKGKNGKVRWVKVPTLAARELGQQNEQFGRNLRADVKLKNRELDIADRENKVALAQYHNERQSDAMDLLNEAMDGTSKGKDTYTSTQPYVIQTKTIQAKNDKAAMDIANGQINNLKLLGQIPKTATIKVTALGNGKYKVDFWEPRDVKTPVPSVAGYQLTDPTQAYNYIVGAGYSRRIAMQVVRSRFNLKATWKPGQKKGKK